MTKKTLCNWKSRFPVTLCASALGASLLLASGCQSSATEATEDPGAEEAATVTTYITAWVAKQAGADGVYDIPARGGHDVSGTMGDFHSVHRRDADTYYVCVDFHDGDDLYDIDFVVDQSGQELVLADHYLHKVNGEVVE